MEISRLDGFDLVGEPVELCGGASGGHPGECAEAGEQEYAAGRDSEPNVLQPPHLVVDDQPDRALAFRAMCAPDDSVALSLGAHRHGANLVAIELNAQIGERRHAPGGRDEAPAGVLQQHELAWAGGPLARDRLGRPCDVVRDRRVEEDAEGLHFLAEFGVERGPVRLLQEHDHSRAAPLTSRRLTAIDCSVRRSRRLRAWVTGARPL